MSEDLIICHEDNSPLERHNMKRTTALMKLIKMARDGELNYESKTAVKRAAKKTKATREDVANLVLFMGECEDAFGLSDRARESIDRRAQQRAEGAN